MATIGTFKLQDGIYTGEIETLSCAPAPVRIVPIGTKPNSQAPDFRVYRGASEIGAAWIQTTKAGRRYLIVSLDDPAFARPIDCRLVLYGEGYTLMWSRPSP